MVNVTVTLRQKYMIVMASFKTILMASFKVDAMENPEFLFAPGERCFNRLTINFTEVVINTIQ